MFLFGESSKSEGVYYGYMGLNCCLESRNQSLVLSRDVAVKEHVTDPDLLLGQVERLVNSHTLHGSELLCKLLRYLADQAVKHPGVSVKEYQIATEVLGRASDFDPQMDSLVRVHAGRLRTKLSEYYSSEGTADSTIVELAKGSYTLAFRPNTTRVVARPPLVETEPTPPEHKVVSAVAVPWALLLVAVIVVGVLLASRTTPPQNAIVVEPVPAVFKTFWQKFVLGPEEPWVIFSNGAFVGRPETGLRYFDATKDSRQAILDHYTGVGEVLAVDAIDHVLGRMHQQIRIKRGSLFSLDDAENNNLIFVGSPAENLTLLDIPTTHEFIFQRPTSGPRRGDLAIRNVHPTAGEPNIFFPTAPGTPLAEDYAVVALAPGLSPRRSILTLAGTTTIGTEAAAEYVSREDSLEHLLLRLRVPDNGEMKPFEALLRVRVARGVPVGTELVAVRKIAN